MLHPLLCADFRKEAAYLPTAFDLILSLYQLSGDPTMSNLRKSLREPEII